MSAFKNMSLSFNKKTVDFKKMSIYNKTWTAYHILIFERLLLEAERKGRIKFEMAMEFFIQDLHIKVYTVRKILQEFKDAGYITTYRENKYYPTTYVLNADRLKKESETIFDRERAERLGMDHYITYHEEHMNELKTLHEKSFINSSGRKFMQRNKQGHVNSNLPGK